ncbi:hypothetical protein D3C76_626300 [compost metagenome]
MGIAQVHLQVHLWMSAQETAAHLVEKGRAEGRRRSDAQVAAQFVLQLLDALGGQAQLRQRLPRAFQIQVPGLGQRHAPGGALEQPCAKFLLQLRHGLGKRGRRLAELFGSAAEVAMLGGGDKHVERAQFVHRFIPDRHRSCARDGIQLTPSLG